MSCVCCSFVLPIITLSHALSVCLSSLPYTSTALLVCNQISLYSMNVESKYKFRLQCYRCVACQTGLEGRYTTKNVIYRLDFAICIESYIRDKETSTGKTLGAPESIPEKIHGEHTMALHTKAHQFPLSPLQ